VDAQLVELDKDRVRTLDMGNVGQISRFERIQDQDHAAVERLLAHSPANECRRDVIIEEEEGVDERDGR
jgi:hypothetical protein